jgi:hypothetical protein
MRTPLLLAVLFVSIVSVGPAAGQSVNYAVDCAKSVDNATVHVPANDALSLPNGTAVEPGDTLAVYTDRGTCAGYGVWGGDGTTFAVAGPDSSVQNERGYPAGAPLKFEVFDVSEGTTVNIGASVRYASCSDATLPLCRDDGRYADGTVHQVAGFSMDALPVELAAFTASLDGQTALLKWKTASETNNAGFEVRHRAPDADTFGTVTFVEGAGTTDQPRSYRARAEDLNPGTHRFRLRQIDTDGSAHTTDPVRVRVEVKRALALQPPAPNPTQRSARLAFTTKQDGPATVALYNVLGQRVRTLYDRPARAGREHEVEVSTDGLSSGTYFVRLRAPSGTTTRRVVVVQ